MSQSEEHALMKLINSLTISPEEAKSFAEKAMTKAVKKGADRDEEWARAQAADIIIAKYARITALTGAASAVPAIIPGIGTVIAITGGVSADTLASIRFQIDMCKCLSALYGCKIETQDAQYLSILLALLGTLEKASTAAGVKLASQAGVRMLRMYLKGPVLFTIKQAFRRIGIIFARKSVEKAIPFIGIPLSGATAYAFTRYVGWEAKKWMEIDSKSANEDAEAKPEPEPVS